MNGAVMKPYFYILLLPLLFGCNSKNVALEGLQANAKHFKDTANTEYLLTNDAIVYFTLKDNNLLLQLINKDVQSTNKIQSCTINKKEYPVTEDTTKEWDNNYIILLNKKLNKISIKCTLSNGSSIKKIIKRK